MSCVYLVLLDNAVIFRVVVDADEATELARLVHGMVVRLPVIADFRPGDDPIHQATQDAS